MKSSRDIEKMFEDLQDTTSAEMDERVLRDVSQALGKPNRRDIGRIIMKSRITKLAVAAVIIIAVMIGVNQFGGSIDGASVAWGEVLDAMNKVPTVVFDMINTTAYSENKTMSTKAVVYDAGEYGSRVDMYMNGELFIQKFLLPKENIAYTIRSKEKMYYRYVLSESQAKVDGDAPRQWVKMILSEGYTELGQGKINGIDVEGVEIQNSELLGGEEGVVRLWVDVKTNLPVRMELEGMMNEDGVKVPMKFVMDDFQWDVELEQSVFEPNIPDDYRLVEEGGDLSVSVKEQESPKAEQKPSKILLPEESDEQSKVKEVATKLFQACAKEDWDGLSEVWPGLVLNEMQKSAVGGLEIISIGEPFKKDDSLTWYVPSEIKFKVRGIRKKNLRIIYDEATQKYMPRGGF
jgi:hypothetical protein